MHYKAALLRERILSASRKSETIINDIIRGKWTAEEYPEKLLQVLKNSFSDPLAKEIAAGLLIKKADEISNNENLSVTVRAQINFVATEAIKIMKASKANHSFPSFF
jgi:hypothetical protein